MSKETDDNVHYVEKWADEATQCKNCKGFQNHDGKNVCVPTDGSMTFEESLREYGEVSPEGHCDNFEGK